MILRNVVEFTHMMLCLVPKVFDPADVFVVLHERFIVIDPFMFKL